MKLSISDSIRVYASKKLEKWKNNATDAWKETPVKERAILKKYANMLLKKMKDEPFPDGDKEILTKHAKGFIKFLNSL